MGVNYKEPTLKPDELTLSLIASGLIRLHERLKNVKAPTLPYPPELQRGLDRLVLLCLRQRKTPPQGVPDLLDWCRKPLAEWPLELPEDAGSADRLLDGQIPTSLCDEWAIISSDIEAELTQKKLLLNVMQVCQSAASPDSYVAFRRLLISQPVLTSLELVKHGLDPCLERLKDHLNTAYELAPETYSIDGNFYCCANCGNLMARTEKGDLICGEERDRCQNLGKPGRQIAQREGVYWIKRGIRRFIAAPGRAELRLADKLKELGLDVELWPNFDSYDLRIVFPDQEVWAIDVKDWVNPFLLANKVKKQSPYIPSDPPWQKAYFVFPDARKQQRTDYLRAFNHHCTLPKDIRAKFEYELIKDVKNKLGSIK